MKIGASLKGFAYFIALSKAIMYITRQMEELP